jgi:predicted lactoylglutathione lyase
MANETVQKYFDSLLQSYDIMVDAIEKSSERGLKFSKQFANDVAKGQREAIELGKKIATEPGDLGQFYAAMMQTATAAQGRVLSFAQLAYSEAMTAGNETRETVEKLMAASKETTQAAMEAARSYGADNPWTETLRKNWDQMMKFGGMATGQKA